MVIRPLRFNIYLLLTAALMPLLGCQTAEKKAEQQMATLRIHLETNPLLAEQSEVVSVIRSAPMLVCVEKYPFLNESHLAAARVVDNPDGFTVFLQFNHQGQRLLEQYSSANSRRRFAIRTQFRQSTNAFDRWIAAPLITGRIPDGILGFTPDANRAEAEAMVLGWNNVANLNEPKKKDEGKKNSATPK